MSLAERPRIIRGAARRLAAGALPGPSAADWAGALLTSGTEGLIGAVRNYLGPVKTPYDKRELASRLEAFLRREETRASILSLLDALDARIIGSALLAGPCSEPALRELFVGEMPLFDLGLRIDNLLDRLILFRFQAGGRRLVAVNPILEADLRRITLDPELLLGREPGSGAGGGAPVTAELAVGFFSFVFHSPSALRKSGGLTKKGAERAAALFPSLSSDGRIDGLARAFAAAGLFRAEGDCRVPDRDAFSRELAAWGRDLPHYLAAALSLAEDAEAEERGEASAEAPAPSAERRARELGAAMAAAKAALPERFAPARSALPRWLRIVARRLGLSVEATAAAGALEALGLAGAPGPDEGPGAAQAGAAGGKRGPALVAEGSHALHLMPEASLEERLLVGSAARPVSLEKVWSFEVDRETARRAFASGLGALSLRASLEGMSGARLPQSLAFSLAEWEEEYRSLRLYRGFVLVADERQRPIVERSAALGRIVAEALAPGVYFLSAATQEEAAEALAAAGLEAPPAAESSKAAGLGARPAGPVEAAGARSSAQEAGGPASAPELRFWNAAGGAAASGAAAAGATRPGPAPLDPGPRLVELRAAVAASARTEEERRELGERVERRLVLTERQIAESDPRSERLEAGGLDYLGKVRVVERALRGRGDRLEVLYRLPGAEPVRALLRPVRLERNEKGLVLEAEDLGTGGPARVPLGAVSTVRRVRASLFGDDQ
jgi:hypothetical protein